MPPHPTEPMPSASEVPPPARMGPVMLGMLSGIAVTLIWSGWAVATRSAMTTALAPQDVTFLRFGVSALFLWPVLLREGLQLRRIGVARAIVMVAGAGAPFMLLSSLGMRFAPASHVATLMIGVMPIFVALLATLFFGERFTRGQLLGIGVVAAGVLCVGGSALIFNRAVGEWRGDLLFLLCGLLFAGFTLAQRRSGVSSWHAAALVNVVSCLVFTPVYFLWLGPNLLAVPVGSVVFQALAQGVGVAILGLYFYAETVRRLGPTRAAMFGALVPAVTVLIGIPALGEYPGWATLMGIALVMLGVVLVVTGTQANTRKPDPTPSRASREA